MDTLIRLNIKLRCILIWYKDSLELRNGAKHAKTLKENREKIDLDKKMRKDRWSMKECREKCLSKLESRKKRTRMKKSLKRALTMKNKRNTHLQMKHKARGSLNTLLLMTTRKESLLKSSLMRLLSSSLENQNREYLDSCKPLLY